MRLPSNLKTRITVSLLLVPFLATVVPLPAVAAMIGTDEALAAERRAAAETKIEQALNRGEVREQLVALGVDPLEAKDRVSSLSDSELEQLAASMDTLPAGAGVGEVIIIVFLLLLVLELMGETDIFKTI